MDLVDIGPAARAVIGIIGGGAAGVLTAAAVARACAYWGTPVTVLIVEPRPRLGPGLAYSTSDPRHVLNAPAGQMGAQPSNPDGFLRWLHRHGHDEVDAYDFVPRQWYGDYLTATLWEAAEASPSVQVRHVRDRAVTLRRHAGRIEVELATGTSHVLDAAVLAVGNVEARLGWAPSPPRESAGSVPDPWAAGALDRIGNARSVLLVGTGLTMVDVALSLARPSRVLTAISRNGRLPKAHLARPAPPVPPPVDLIRGSSLLAMSGVLRRHLRTCCRLHGDWRPGFDGLRPFIPALWRQLTEAERAQAIAQYSSWWSQHRHRMAPQLAQALHGLLRTGQLRISAGEVINARRHGTGIRLRLRDGRVLDTDAVVNCAGQQTDLRKVKDPLMTSILANGIARPGPAGLGLDTDAEGRILDRTGTPTAGLFTLGNTRIGQLWETTAISEIREQASNIGTQLTAELSAPLHRTALSANAAHRSRSSQTP